MLDPAYVRDISPRSKRACGSRGLDPSTGSGRAGRARGRTAAADSRRREPEARSEHRGRSGRAREEGRPRPERDLRREQGARGDGSANWKRSSPRSSGSATRCLLTLPNLPHESVPVGKSAADNVEVAPLGHAARVRLRAEAALGARPRARHSRFRACDADVRRAILRAARRRRAARARAHQFHARPAHARARLPGSRAAVSREHARRSPARATCRSSSRICSRSPATGICS